MAQRADFDQSFKRLTPKGLLNSYQEEKALAALSVCDVNKREQIAEQCERLRSELSELYPNLSWHNFPWSVLITDLSIYPYPASSSEYLNRLISQLISWINMAYNHMHQDEQIAFLAMPHNLLFKWLHVLYLISYENLEMIDPFMQKIYQSLPRNYNLDSKLITDWIKQLEILKNDLKLTSGEDHVASLIERNIDAQGAALSVLLSKELLSMNYRSAWSQIGQSLLDIPVHRRMQIIEMLDPCLPLFASLLDCYIEDVRGLDTVLETKFIKNFLDCYQKLTSGYESTDRRSIWLALMKLIQTRHHRICAFPLLQQSFLDLTWGSPPADWKINLFSKLLERFEKEKCRVGSFQEVVNRAKEQLVKDFSGSSVDWGWRLERSRQLLELSLNDSIPEIKNIYVRLVNQSRSHDSLEEEVL